MRWFVFATFALTTLACVPMLELDGAPCAGALCADGYMCCKGTCQRIDEPCIGACIDDRLDEGQSARYMPFVVDSRWTYLVTTSGSGSVEWKRLMLGPEAPIGGFAEGAAHALCREVRNSLGVLLDGALRWERDNGRSAEWLRNLRIDLDAARGATKDEYPDGRALRLDEDPDKTCVGHRFTHAYDERVVRPERCPYVRSERSWDADDAVQCADNGGLEIIQKSDVWTVEAIDEPLSFAGNEVSTLRVRREQSASDIDAVEVSTFWFARGLGKIKEVTVLQETEDLLYVDVPGVAELGVDPDPTFQTDACSAEWWPTR